MKEEIEIVPGVFVMVTPKVKLGAGVAKLCRMSSTLSSVDRYRAMESSGFIGRHSVLIVDEAVSLATDMGARKASAITGVPVPTIVNRMREKGVECGGVLFGQIRADIGKLRECVRVAKELMASEEMKEVVVTRKGKKATHKIRRWSHGTAFVEAGKRVGISGKTAERLWLQGRFSLTSNQEVEQRPASPSKADASPTPEPPYPPAIDETNKRIGLECDRLRELSAAGHPLVDTSGRIRRRRKTRKLKGEGVKSRRRRILALARAAAKGDLSSAQLRRLPHLALLRPLK